MNHQVGTSILISVCIVGFFAVALFRPDPARRDSDQFSRRPGVARGTEVAQGSGSRHAVAQGEHRSQSPGPPGSGRVEPRAPSVGLLTNEPAGPAASRSARAGGPLARPGTADRTGGDDERRVGESGTSSWPAVRTAWSRPDGRSAAPGAGPVSGRRPSGPLAPPRSRAAFTVVEPNETITDVALRVYGTTDDVEVLWRANRDTLPRRDSPLSPGTLLRTPALR
jgi:hypothetical protein